MARFAGSHDDGVISLSWDNPADADFSGVRVQRSDTAYPQSPLQGDTVYNGTAKSFSDTGLRGGATYYYAAFSYDAAGNFASAATLSATAVYNPFTLAVFPDTQYYTIDYPDMLNTMFQWCVDNQAAHNIAFVLHEGDITNNNNDPQWTNAKAAISRLDNKIPYALAVGNHDMIGGTTAPFNSYFPQSYMQTLPGFGGVFEQGKMDSAWYTFHAGGNDWLVISLPYDPGDNELAWAGAVAEAPPNHRAILVTHAYLTNTNARTSIGNNIWNKLVRKYPNFLLVFNGHYTDGTYGRLASSGDAGNTVYQMFADYQTEWFGGRGLIRLVTLDPNNSSISVKTWSPPLRFYRDGDGDQFTYENVDLAPMP